MRAVSGNFIHSCSTSFTEYCFHSSMSCCMAKMCATMNVVFKVTVVLGFLFPCRRLLHIPGTMLYFIVFSNHCATKERCEDYWDSYLSWEVYSEIFQLIHFFVCLPPLLLFVFSSLMSNHPPNSTMTSLRCIMEHICCFSGSCRPVECVMACWNRKLLAFIMALRKKIKKLTLSDKSGPFSSPDSCRGGVCMVLHWLQPHLGPAQSQ